MVRKIQKEGKKKPIKQNKRVKEEKGQKEKKERWEKKVRQVTATTLLRDPLLLLVRCHARGFTLLLQLNVTPPRTYKAPFTSFPHSPGSHSGTAILSFTPSQFSHRHCLAFLLRILLFMRLPDVSNLCFTWCDCGMIVLFVVNGSALIRGAGFYGRNHISIFWRTAWFLKPFQRDCSCCFHGSH